MESRVQGAALHPTAQGTMCAFIVPQAHRGSSKGDADHTNTPITHRLKCYLAATRGKQGAGSIPLRECMPLRYIYIAHKPHNPPLIIPPSARAAHPAPLAVRSSRRRDQLGNMPITHTGSNCAGLGIGRGAAGGPKWFRNGTAQLNDVGTRQGASLCKSICCADTALCRFWY